MPGGVNIGVLAGEDNQFILVDTGLNDTSAKKALKAVREELGGEVRFVLTTTPTPTTTVATPPS